MRLSIPIAAVLLSLSYFEDKNAVDALSTFRRVKNRVKDRILRRRKGGEIVTPTAEPLERVPGGTYSYAHNNKDIRNLLGQNAAWVQATKTRTPDFFDRLGQVHTPSYLYIGCSDARVPPNVVMKEDPGSIFVVRNVANLVVNTDFNLMSAMQYAVAVLKVPHIIVCGHYECGGVRASVMNQDHTAPLENWLRNIRDIYRIHRKELEKIKDPEQRHRRLVELNVIEQCINVYKSGPVQQRRAETFQDPNAQFSLPIVHACVFDPNTGILNELDVDFEEKLGKIEGIYSLYEVKQ